MKHNFNFLNLLCTTGFCVYNNNKKGQLKSYCKQSSQLDGDTLYNNHVLDA